MEGIIRLENVTFLSDQFEVLRNVSLTVSRGQCTVIVGPSGAGKSILLKTIAGILQPQFGKVWIEGTELLRMSEKQTKEFRKKNGFVFQDSALWANRSMYQNLELPLKFHFPEVSDKKTRETVNELLDRIGLRSQSHLRPANLSFGEQKIVSFARALVLKPSILFMDEPTQSIDIRILRVMNEMIRELKSRQCTMVIVTHDQDLTSQVADNLVVIKAGQILEDGPFDSVKNSRSEDVQAVLSSVLSRAASYDTDILGLLDGDLT